MQYNHRSRLPPPPFGRGGGPGYFRGHEQLYGPPLPPPLPPPPPQGKYEVLMEAGRLAAEYLVSQGVLPPAALQRGAASADFWAAPSHPYPQPPLQQQQEPPGFCGRRRYDDDYRNNPSARPRRATGASNSSRDDYNSGSYNGRGKRKYGEYRRGYSNTGRYREKERGSSSSNGQRYEVDDDEDGAPGFRRERRGSRGSNEIRSSLTAEVREETLSTAKAVVGLEMEDTRSKSLSSAEDVQSQKDAEAVLEVQDENEEGELNDSCKVSNSDTEVVEQALGTEANNAYTGIMKIESKHLPDDKVPDKKSEDGIDDKVHDKKGDDGENILGEAALDHNTSDIEVPNVGNSMCECDDRRSLLDDCNFARAPTRPRSVRARKNVIPARGETSVAERVDLVSCGQVSEMAIDESAKESSLVNIQPKTSEGQICQEDRNSSVLCDEPMEPMLLQENETSVVTANMREEKGDAKPNGVREYKEENNQSPMAAAHKDSLPQEDSLQGTDLSRLTTSDKDSLSQGDSLMQELDLSPLTGSHTHSLTEEAKLSPLTVSCEGSLMHQTDLFQTSSVEDTLKLQFEEGTQICDIDSVPQDVDLIELSVHREIEGADPCPNIGEEAGFVMEERKLDQSSSLKVSSLDLVDGTGVAAMHDDTSLAHSSAAISSTEPHKQHQEDPGTVAGATASTTNEFCHLPLENKCAPVLNIECDTQIQSGGIASSKLKNETICPSMDNMMHPGLHTDVLPGIQDVYSLAFSDFPSADIPCYPPVPSDLHATIGANDSEEIAIIDDPIYGSLTDIGFMDVWGQPAQDFDKFF